MDASDAFAFEWASAGQERVAQRTVPVKACACMSQGQRVVSLYRRILRCGHHWQGTSEVMLFLLVLVCSALPDCLQACLTYSGVLQEKAFILQEAHKRFREAGAGSLDKRLEEGQQRLEYAEHYGAAEQCPGCCCQPGHCCMTSVCAGIPYPRLHHSRGQFKGRRYDVPES